jgi:glycosyltransferase involved in cell wall biosynthesis
MSEKNPTIDIAVYMVTYNHEKFIDKAIESVLTQKTTFNFKIFIGEDRSEDLTREKCINWSEKYPDLIELIFSDKNVGIYNNVSRVFSACINSGAKYIALLEGDDYWSDCDKLQRQVEILEADDSIAGSYHNTEFLYKDGERKPMKNSLPLVLELKDVISKYAPFHTSSFVFRAKDFCRPVWFQKIDSVDMAMYVWHAQFGRFEGINKVMSVYRVHEKGLTASISRSHNLDTPRLVMHRMMRGRIPHSSFNKYQELIDFHSSKTDDSWKSIIPSCAAFYEGEDNAMDMDIRKFKMNLTDEIVNFKILETMLHVQNTKISLSKHSKFLNRLKWNNFFYCYIGRKPDSIIFTSQSSIDCFIYYFGKMRINAIFLFDAESIDFSAYKSNFTRIHINTSHIANTP